MLCQAGIKAEEKPIRMCRPILWMSQSRTFRATLGIQTGDRGSGIRDIGDKGRARRTSSRLIDVGYISQPNPNHDHRQTDTHDSTSTQLVLSHAGMDWPSLLIPSPGSFIPQRKYSRNV